MNTKAQQKFLSKITPGDVGGKPDTVQFVLGNGLRVEANMYDMPEDIRDQLAIHGLSQKIGDAASGYAKDRDFGGAFGAMQSVADNLAKGLWSSRSATSNTDLASALAELQGLSIETAQELIDKMTEEQLATVKKHPAVKEAVSRLQAERLKKAAEAAEPLADLLAGIGM